VQRRALVLVIGEDLSLAAVIRVMTQEEEEWRAVTVFCEAVMTAKEEAERERRERRRMPPHYMCRASGEYCGEKESARAPGPAAGPSLRRRKGL